jgi:hypothetical protein
MKTYCLGIALIAVSLSLGAQSQTPPPVPHGMIVDVMPVPQSLKQVVDMSSLIIEGIVEKVMPARRGAGQAWVETDSVISIAQTFKGSAGGSTIVIAQMGGRVGEDQPVQYSIVQLGERYILGLKEDNRTTVPPVAGLKRYGVTAAWAGLLFVGSDGLIHTDSKYTDPLRKTFEGKSKASMIDLINNAMVPAPTPVPPPFPGILK